MADRGAMMKALQAAVRARGLRDAHDDSPYREWLKARTGKTSAKELTLPQLKRLLNEINGKTRPAPNREALLAKLDAQLHEAGRTRDYLEGGAAPMVKRICGVARVAFCDPEMLQKLVAALAYDAGRHGRTL